MPRLFGGGSFGVRFQRRLGGADRLDPLLLVGDPVGHLIAACVAVQLVIVGIRGLGRAQPVVDFSLQLGLACLHALIAHRLVCLEAFALILVPSSATWPSFTRPAFSASFKTCTNSPASAFRCRLRKSLMVRKSGPSSAAIIMKSARSAHALAIRREE